MSDGGTESPAAGARCPGFRQPIGVRAAPPASAAPWASYLLHRLVVLDEHHTTPGVMMPKLELAPLLAGLVLAGCGADSRPFMDGWTGTMDTLPSGHIVVRNDDRPLWREDTGWRVVEELRIGSVEGEGPEVFGEVEAFEVDGEGRILVLERIAAQLIVFDAAGGHVRTIGRRGGGPGEFMQPVAMHFAPDGHLWVVDVGTHRTSVLDTAGEYVDGMQIPARFRMIPWPRGGFDDQGRYYTPTRATPAPWEMLVTTLVRHDSALVPRDTLERPRDPIRREVFEYPGALAIREASRRSRSRAA